MASNTFSPVNTSLVPDPHGRNGEETNPLTPRPSTAPSSQQLQQPAMARDDARTPTRANFGALAGQRPLPPASSPFVPAVPAVPTTSNDEPPEQGLSRGDSQYSAKSRDSEDVDMESDNDGEEGSDDEASVNADGSRSSKKKGKSQRFYCQDYPPCNLSFTRSEHLARHIRKHTGERPFQCHCSRRFSRLDNLRQHAQTVHQNEDIPPESLAATGTRFQRQVRTDRVRPPGRSRASTAGSQASQGRGHQRNSLSLSSMTSVGSAGSIFSARDDIRRRPPPLVMAGERSRFSQEIYRPDSPSSSYYRQDPYRPQSPGFSTPTSATFSTGQNSPHWGSGMQSPGSTHSRTASIYAGHRTPGRRLSVPSAGNPFQSPHGNSFGPQVIGQMNASNMGSFSPSGSMISSPTTSTSGWSRRESINGVDYESRRRTWHPDSRPALEQYTSRLQQVTTPNQYAAGPGPLPQPPVVPSQPMRLPGIESFDPLPRPTTPIRRQPSPMMIDTPSRAPMHPEYQQERPISQHWEQGINRNMDRLEIAQTPPSDAANQWANETNRAVQIAREQARQQPAVRFEESPYQQRPQTSGGYQQHPHHVSAPVQPVTPREAKRQAWYHGPPPVMQQPVQRTSPAESSGSEGGIPGTPSSSTMGEYNPGIVHANGWVENRNGLQQHDPRLAPTNGYAPYPPQGAEGAYTYGPGAHQNQVQQNEQVPKSRDMLRLEALVAVATAEGEAKQEAMAAAY